MKAFRIGSICEPPCDPIPPVPDPGREDRILAHAERIAKGLAAIRRRDRKIDAEVNEAWRRHELSGYRRASREQPRSSGAILSDRGERWGSQAEAGRALGVNRMVAWRALHWGWRCAGRVLWYEGQPRPSAKPKRDYRTKCRPIIRDDGVRFPSVSAAVQTSAQRERLRRAVIRGQMYEGHYYRDDK